MARYSIDYLNARRESRPASGGKRYELHRNAVDERAQHAGMDEFERIGLAAHRVFADIRKRNAEWRNQWRSKVDVCADIPF